MGKERFSLAIAATALLTSFALAACGGGSNNSADEDQITAAINASAVGGDPSACTKYQTTKFVQQTSGGESAQASLKTCEHDASSGNGIADKVDVTDISVDGNSATANAEITGSIFDGQTLNLVLIKENGQWKLDVFKGFEDFDKSAFTAAFPQALSQQENVNSQGVDCLKTQIQAASDQEIENAYVNNDQTLFNKLFGTCGKYFPNG